MQIYWCRSSIFRHLKLELLTQFPASNDEKYINVVYIWRKFVSFYGYVHWRMTTEISVMYGSEKVKRSRKSQLRHLWLKIENLNNHIEQLYYYNAFKFIDCFLIGLEEWQSQSADWSSESCIRTIYYDATHHIKGRDDHLGQEKQ